MKTISFLSLALCWATIAMAQTPPASVAAATPASADRDWTEMEQLVAQQRPEPRPKSAIEYFQWVDAHYQKIQQLGLAFFAHYPTDARRWDAAFEVLDHPPLYYASYKPEFNQDSSAENAVIDTAAKTAWHARRAGLIATIEGTPEATIKAREMAAVVALRAEFENTGEEQKPALTPKLVALAARFPAGEQVYYFVSAVARKFARTQPQAAQALWADLLISSHLRLREAAEGMGRLQAGATTPLEMHFTALDGHEVDLAALRGKVVLIDFWATWCGPCIAELPNVKKVYAGYHDKGFEIIGISLDGPEDGERLKAFLKKNDLPWPQYFDGKNWQTPPALKYAVSSIPAMLLLDRAGRIVSTNARGTRLEEAVKKYLGP
ncbi:MAG: TlpA disulfide reductase family protein [Lacunisphaera sp.]